MTIHERIIARLMETRSGFYWCNKCAYTGYSGPQHANCGYNAIKLEVTAFTAALIDMAIDNVRRKWMTQRETLHAADYRTHNEYSCDHLQ